MTGDLAVEATGLQKSYGAAQVLAGVDLRVERGSVFALLGPNGAGKTTTVRILSTLIRADAGQARVAGFDVVRERRRVRRSIGLTGQYAAVDELLTGAENLRMMGRLSGCRAGWRAAAPASCWSGSTWPTPSTGRSRPGPAGCAGGWTLPPAWSSDRRCCSSTSRPPGWTPVAGRRCGRSPATWPGRG
jgi:ABC transporter family protein